MAMECQCTCPTGLAEQHFSFTFRTIEDKIFAWVGFTKANKGSSTVITQAFCLDFPFPLTRTQSCDLHYFKLLQRHLDSKL